MSKELCFSVDVDIGKIKRAYGFDEEGVFHGIQDAKTTVLPSSLQAYKAAPSFVIPSSKPPSVPKPFIVASTPENLSQRYLVSIVVF